jgi:hypothetical protein
MRTMGGWWTAVNGMEVGGLLGQAYTHAYTNTLVPLICAGWKIILHM